MSNGVRRSDGLGAPAITPRETIPTAPTPAGDPATPAQAPTLGTPGQSTFAGGNTPAARPTMPALNPPPMFMAMNPMAAVMAAVQQGGPFEARKVMPGPWLIAHIGAQGSAGVQAQTDAGKQQALDELKLSLSAMSPPCRLLAMGAVMGIANSSSSPAVKQHARDLLAQARQFNASIPFPTYMMPSCALINSAAIGVLDAQLAGQSMSNGQTQLVSRLTTLGSEDRAQLHLDELGTIAADLVP